MTTRSLDSGLDRPLPGHRAVPRTTEPAVGKRTLVESLAPPQALAGAPSHDGGPPGAGASRRPPRGATEPSAMPPRGAPLDQLFGVNRASLAQRRAGGPVTGRADPPAPGGGTALPELVRGKMESAFGADFSAVRVHIGEHAQAAGALAYTTGQDIHFAPGQYDPSSQRGQELIGHELAHVVQQRDGRVSATGQAAGLAINDDEGLEREADELGARAAAMPAMTGPAPRGAGPATASTGIVQRKVGFEFETQFPVWSKTGTPEAKTPVRTVGGGGATWVVDHSKKAIPYYQAAFQDDLERQKTSLQHEELQQALGNESPEKVKELAEKLNPTPIGTPLDLGFRAIPYRGAILEMVTKKEINECADDWKQQIEATVGAMAGDADFLEQELRATTPTRPIQAESGLSIGFPTSDPALREFTSSSAFVQATVSASASEIPGLMKRSGRYDMPMMGQKGNERTVERQQRNHLQLSSAIDLAERLRTLLAEHHRHTSSTAPTSDENRPQSSGFMFGFNPNPTPSPSKEPQSSGFTFGFNPNPNPTPSPSKEPQSSGFTFGFNPNPTPSPSKEPQSSGFTFGGTGAFSSFFGGGDVSSVKPEAIQAMDDLLGFFAAVSMMIIGGQRYQHSTHGVNKNLTPLLPKTKLSTMVNQSLSPEARNLVVHYRSFLVKAFLELHGLDGDADFVPEEANSPLVGAGLDTIFSGSDDPFFDHIAFLNDMKEIEPDPLTPEGTKESVTKPEQRGPVFELRAISGRYPAAQWTSVAREIVSDLRDLHGKK